MKHHVFFVIFGPVALLGAVASAADFQMPPNGAIICCEQAEAWVLLLDPDADWNDESKVLWSWAAKDCPDMSERQARWFHHLTDAKRVLGGTHVLVSASGGGVALVRMEDGRAPFFGFAGGNTHSVEILPDGTIVSASSSGNYLSLFSRNPAPKDNPRRPPFKKIPMEDPHGLTWDHERSCLWTLGGRELKKYRYNNNAAAPDLEEIGSFELPEHGGHDLCPVPGRAQLFLTIKDTWIFDVASGQFTKFEPASATPRLKSISQREPGGPIIIMVPTESWWSDTIRFLGEDRMKTRKNARFYKTRWWCPNTFSYGPGEQEE